MQRRRLHLSMEQATSTGDRDADIVCRRDRLRLLAIAETMAEATEEREVSYFHRLRIIRLFCSFISSRKRLPSLNNRPGKTQRLHAR
jgi:hypothetical protein